MIIRERDLRPNRHLGPDEHALLRPTIQIDMRPVHRLELVLFERARVHLRHEVLERLALDTLFPCVLLEDLAGHAAGAETGQFETLHKLAKRALLRGRKLLRRDVDLELDLGRTELFDGRAQCVGNDGKCIANIRLSTGRLAILEGVAGLKLERKTRFELATLALARRCSTAELLPR